MNEPIEPTGFDEMIGESIKEELERQGVDLRFRRIDWGKVGRQAVEAYGFGPDTMPGGTWPTGRGGGGWGQ